MIVQQVIVIQPRTEIMIETTVLMATSLRQEVVVIIVHVREIILCTGLAAEGLAVAELLEIVQTARDALVAIGIEGIEVDGSPAVDAGVELAGIEDRLAISVHHTGLGCAVGVDEVAACISGIVRALLVAVTQRSLECLQGRHGLAVALEFCLPFFVSCLNASLALLHSHGVGLRNDEGHAVLRCAAVDCLRLVDDEVAEAGVLACNDLCGIDNLCHVNLPPENH